MQGPTGIILESDPSFLREIWAWYIIGFTTIFLRYVVRLRTVGIRGFQGDDWITMLSLGLYTMDAVLVTIVYYTGANVDVPASAVDSLSDHDISIIAYGSKSELAAWYSYTGLIWCMKFTLLFFYKRLTLGTMQSKTVTYMFWLCGATYLAVFGTITFGCHPFTDNWRVRPLPSRACTFKPQNLYVTVILNVITDAVIMMIPIPMLWRLKVSLSRKLGIAALLSSGLFVIAAAIIRAVLTLGAAPSALNINRWGVRETIIGLLTVTLPILRPLFNRSFWRKGEYHPDSNVQSNSWSKSGTKSAYGRGTFELRSNSDNKDISIMVTNASQEEIFKKNSNELANGVVLVEQTYDISSHRRDEESGMGDRGADWSRDNAIGYNTKVTASSQV